MECRAVVEHFASEIAIVVIRVRPDSFSSALLDDLQCGVVDVFRVANFCDIVDGIVLVGYAVAFRQVAFGIACIGGERIAVDGDGAHFAALIGVGKSLLRNGIRSKITSRVLADGDSRSILIGESRQIAVRVVFKGEILDGGRIACNRHEAFIVVGVFILISRNFGAEQSSISAPRIADNISCACGDRYYVAYGIISPSLF